MIEPEGDNGNDEDADALHMEILVHEGALPIFDLKATEERLEFDFEPGARVHCVLEGNPTEGYLGFCTALGDDGEDGEIELRMHPAESESDEENEVD